MRGVAGGARGYPVVNHCTDKCCREELLPSWFVAHMCTVRGDRRFFGSSSISDKLTSGNRAFRCLVLLENKAGFADSSDAGDSAIRLRSGR